MALDIACPECGEAENLTGTTTDDSIVLTCDSCGHEWDRSSTPTCKRCGGSDLQTVPLAIVERSRGTQLSIHGTRPIDLCTECDAEALARYHANRPNPLMPTDLPTVGEEHMNG